jgi:TolA-binding protein
MSEHSFIDPTRTRRHRGYRHPLARLLLGVAVAVVMVGARPGAGSWARSPVKLRLGGQLPFTRGQLVRAVALRVRTWSAGKSAPVQVVALGRGNVLVRLDDRRRLVPLLGQRGAPAARRVALAIMDLARTRLRLPAVARVERKWDGWRRRRKPRGIGASLVISHRPSSSASLTLLAAGVLLAGTTAGGAPPGEVKRAREIKELLEEMSRFESAARSYRTTVDGIIRRSYRTRRRRILVQSARRIRAEEAEERVRRLAAITILESFLRRHPADPRWSPDVMFRLAELYFEKENDAHLRATDRYDREMARFEAGRRSTAPVQPRLDYRRTIELHRRLVKRFPRYRLVDGAYYLLGFCLNEMGREEQGTRAFLALVCANRQGSAPASAAPVERLPARVPPAPGTRPRLETAVYAGCRPLRRQSRFLAEAWLRIGERHFDENELGPAVAAYRQVLRQREGQYHDAALYKLAWSYYRADHLAEAARHFDRLVVYSDTRTGRRGTEMRPEAIQYLGVVFAEDDWDGDTRPDRDHGLRRLEVFYRGRRGERHVHEIYRRLGEIYFDTTRYAEAVEVFKRMILNWPLRPESPEIQRRIVLALERRRELAAAALERERLGALFGPDSAWARHNSGDHRALAAARRIRAEELLRLATDAHRRARASREGGRPDAAAYRRAERSYRAFLDQFPAHRRRRDALQALASCLFYAGSHLQAARVFEEVRDGSGADGREEAAFMAVKAYEAHVEKQRLRPPPPTEGGVQPLPLPDAYRRLQAAMDTYRRLMPRSARVPILAYKAAEIEYLHRRFARAERRLVQVFRRHCAHPVSITAAQALLSMLQLQGRADRVKAWTERLRASRCGGDPGLSRRTAKEAEEIYQTLKFKEALGLLRARRHGPAARRFLALVEGGLSGERAARALQNAAVAHERAGRPRLAAEVFDRIWQGHRGSALSPEALWRAAVNYQRSLDYDRAVERYLALVSRRGSPRRLGSAFNAAVILEHDRAFRRAAGLYLLYGRGGARDAAEALMRAGRCFERAGDPGAAERAYVELIRRHERLRAPGGQIVEAWYRVGRARARAGRSWRQTSLAYRRAVDAFSARSLRPASEAAEHAARAAFALAEHDLERFKRQRFGGTVAAMQSQRRRVERLALGLKRAYEEIWRYKRVRWTLAATFRRGEVLEHFARTLEAGIRGAPVPAAVRRQGKAAVDLYLDTLDRLLSREVDPLVAAAVKEYEACVVQARRLAVSTPHVDAALERLHAFAPRRWPLPRRIKIERIID